MNSKVLIGIAVGLLTTAVLVMVGAGAYRAGQRSDQTIEVVGDVVTNGEDSARTVLVPVDGWHDGWRGGPGFGFFVFPLVIIGLVLLFASRRGGPWRGPWRDDELRDWHRRQHDQPAPPAPPAS
jgi:hypothetical protein